MLYDPHTNFYNSQGLIDNSSLLYVGKHEYHYLHSRPQRLQTTIMDSSSEIENVTTQYDYDMFKLPLELREDIYKLVYLTAADKHEKIDLLTAAGPSKSLLLTCRDLNSDARAFQRAAYRRYWREGHFMIRLAAEFFNTYVGDVEQQKLYKIVDHLDEKDLAHVTMVFCSATDSKDSYDAHKCTFWTATFEGNHWHKKGYECPVMAEPLVEGDEIFYNGSRMRRFNVWKKYTGFMGNQLLHGMYGGAEEFLARADVTLDPMKVQITRACRELVYGYY